MPEIIAHKHTLTHNLTAACVLEVCAPTSSGMWMRWPNYGIKVCFNIFDHLFFLPGWYLYEYMCNDPNRPLWETLLEPEATANIQDWLMHQSTAATSLFACNDIDDLATSRNLLIWSSNQFQAR